MAPHLALLLHMHQPDYRDPDSGRPHMPWVRLHACRGYTDVPVLAAELGARPTINVVPSLLLQLAAFRNGATDRWEELSRVPAEDLDEDQRDFVRQRFVHGHPAMRQASPRYSELASRVDSLSRPQDLRDLQVWSNLAWMGSVARRDPFVAELVVRDRHFRHEELLGLMDRQRALVEGVLDLWAQTASLSCSPLCHPILPLLVDLQHARRSLPGLPPDLGPGGRFAWPEDALRHLVEAREVVRRLLGRTPAGLWPSEGAISPEVLELVEEAGFAWVASDEGVLDRSARGAEPRLDHPWVLAGREAGPRLIFRDRDLSDRVGFQYQRWRGEEAVADLLGAAEARWGREAVVPIILDGENPWEAYPDAGEGFLRALFGGGRIVDLDRFARLPARGRIHHLHTGSWIGADLRIWAGDPQDWEAWALLTRLREAWQEAGCPEQAWEHLANAESSDWFWWFGPEFDTPVADLFDALFRAHLAAAWRATGLAVPRRLQDPVVPSPAASGVLLLRRRSDPGLDMPPNLARWAHAAPLPLPTGGAMAQGRPWLLGGAVALGQRHLWLRLDLPPGQERPAMALELDDGRRLHLDPPDPGLRLAEGAGTLILAVPHSGEGAGLALWRLASPGGGSQRRHPDEGWIRLRLQPA